MADHSAWRLELAHTYIAPYADRAPIAVLGGSVAQGVADRWSDIDTIVYWDEVDRDWLETPARGGGRRAVHVGRALPGQRVPGAVPLRHGQGRCRARAAGLARRADRRHALG